jgi:predicted dinucleotide-utilizing enzyme
MLLAAGGLRFQATIGDQPIPHAKVSYTIYVPSAGDPEGRQLASNIHSGEIVRLAEGIYHVVSTYGDTNATVRADLKVESGKLTDATLRHRAATMTLKLVETAGGEALADTSWSVLSPGGDIVQEAVGAFATMTLAEGVYSVVARHAGKTYSRDFKVETGRDGDVEVLAKDGQ